jgi:carbamoyltransferase
MRLQNPRIFSCITVEEQAAQFFALPKPPRHYPARFMLYVVDVRDDKREVIPAITHVDGTRRVQTVYARTSPWYYQLIKQFGMAAGVLVVLNTSFNLKREPIVNTPEDAFSTFSRCGIDVLILDHCLMRKPS